jgi:hypothetical protein
MHALAKLNPGEDDSGDHEQDDDNEDDHGGDMLPLIGVFRMLEAPRLILRLGSGEACFGQLPLRLDFGVARVYRLEDVLVLILLLIRVRILLRILLGICGRGCFR